VKQIAFDLDNSFKEGIEHRPDYEKLKTSIEKNEISLQYAKNQEFPEIDLAASYGLIGLGDSFSDSLKDMDNNSVWSLGVIVKFPLGNSTAKSDLKVAKLEAKQELLMRNRFILSFWHLHQNC